MARVLLLLLLLFFACDPPKESSQASVQKKSEAILKRDIKHSNRFFQMSTVTDCIIFSTEGDTNALFSDTSLAALWKITDSILLDWNNRFSTDSTHSEIYKLNNRDKSTLIISEELYQMLTVIKNFDKKHSRLFDPTIGPLKKFWNPTCKTCKEPSIKNPQTAVELQKILSKVDFSKVVLQRLQDKPTVTFLSSETTLEIGGISKGFVLRKLQQEFKNRGYAHFVISMGGDIFAQGGKPSGKKFRLGVQNPNPDAKEPLAITFNFTEGTVVTSGNYERFRLDTNGDRVHHIYSLKNGYPAKENSSVTITAKDPVTADIYSTALFSLPADSIIAIVDRTDHMECYVIDINGNKSYSDGFFHH